MKIINRKKQFLTYFSAFCAGVSWVSAFVIATLAFHYLSPFGFLTSFIGFIMMLVFGFVFVAVFESLSLLIEIKDSLMPAENHEETPIIPDN